MIKDRDENECTACPTNPGQIAQSVWLHFRKDGFDYYKFQEVKRNGWTLRNTIVVQKSVPSTFFAAIVYGGGYAGIQQLDSINCGSEEGSMKPRAYILSHKFGSSYNN